jgi:hypothetical protein
MSVIPMAVKPIRMLADLIDDPKGTLERYGKEQIEQLKAKLAQPEKFFQIPDPAKSLPPSIAPSNPVQIPRGEINVFGLSGGNSAPGTDLDNAPK